MNGDPLFAPPYDDTRYNPVTLTSAGGGTAFGQLDSLTASGGGGGNPAVPALSVPGLVVLSALLAGGGMRRVEREAAA